MQLITGDGSPSVASRDNLLSPNLGRLTCIVAL